MFWVGFLVGSWVGVFLGLMLFIENGSAADKTVTIFAIKNDENFVASGTGIIMTESPAIPDEFHDALAQYAIMKGYETKPEAIQMAGYFRQQWEMCIREGKKYANTGRDGSSLSIKGYDY